MQALKGINVVDLTRVVAGPYCTYQLALMGASVIKIEQPGRGDPVRHSGAGSDQHFWKHAMATNFLPQNANKRSLTLNLKHTGGNRSLAARNLDIQRTYLSRLIAKYGLQHL